MVLFFRQVWALTFKNILVALVRHWASTPFRAFILPVAFIGFLSYARFLFQPASVYGISDPHSIRSLPEAFDVAGGGRDKLVFINNGFTGGAIERVISQVSAQVADAHGLSILNLEREEELLTQCRNTILGSSTCFAAAVFYGSPEEGNGGLWNYSIRADGALGSKIVVDSTSNDAQVYILPLQHAVDQAISQQNATDTVVPDTVDNFPYTSKTAAQRLTDIRIRYMGGIIDILGVAFFIGMVPVCYQLTGLIAKEREIGMAQLIDSMMPNKKKWLPQAVRIIANHLAFDLIYLPGWIVMSIILSVGVFAQTSFAIILFYNILAGLSISSFSVFGAGFFKRAQLSGITTVIIFMLLAVLAQVVHNTGTGSVAVLSLLFPPMNYVFFVIAMAHWERQDLPMNLVQSPPQDTNSLPGIVFWIFLIVQIMIYPILGALIERGLYGTASRSRQIHISNTDAAIHITGFTKVYKPTWIKRMTNACFRRNQKSVTAVDNLNLVARRGEIMVYLGANGSGKSTTLDAIAGLTSITSGTININYPDHHTSLGLCPQKNVLWDDLTALEHIQIFGKIKSQGKIATKTELKELLNSCDIGLKSGRRSKTFSGGQKRKLQLAMMFVGGSTVCCVDEVSSGLDPLSRRKIWDILLAERGRRSIILTTHFLDEADLLADHIAVLSKGNLKAYGTSVELKHNLGGGYRVHVYHKETESVHQKYNIPCQKEKDQTVYFLPTSDLAAGFVYQLEKDRVLDYQVSGPTIEDVFLKLAEEVKADPDRIPTPSNESDRESNEEIPEPRNKEAAIVSSNPVIPANKNSVPELLTGKRISMLQQASVLFWKRLLVTRRNPLPLLAALLIPIVAAGLVTLFLTDYTLPSCEIGSTPASGISSLNSHYEYKLVAGPSSALTPQVLQSFAATLSSGASTGSRAGNVTQLLNSLTQVDTLAQFNDQISTLYANIAPGGFFLGEDGQAPMIAWKGNGDISNPLILLNMLDNVINPANPVSTRYQPFDVPWPVDAGKALQMITYFGLAFSVAPAFFALYPNLERLRNVRGLHYSNGVRALPLWSAYISFDFILWLVVAAISTALLAATTSSWYNLGYVFVVLALYGLSSMMLSYVVSLFAPSQLASFAMAAAGQAVMFLLYFVTFMSVLTYIPAASQGRVNNIAYFVFGAFSPIANVQHALFMALNIFALACRGQSLASYPGDITVYGGPIMYLMLQSIFLFSFLVWYDSGSAGIFAKLNRRKKTQLDDEASLAIADSELAHELERINTNGEKDGLQIIHLTKQFKDNLAVDDVSFGVPRSEVFALLGPNGAGKSTTISLIRGDIKPSDRRSNILVGAVSVITDRAAARARLGVCPQFDAMDQMTVNEHLAFYARIRGVGNPRHNVKAILQAVGLTQYSDRMAAKLSGGNKRKLSLGIALMGNPAVLLLDEPSSGMDAASKRVMWRTLASVVPGRSIVLTTHSMEEADALADRAGIVSSRMLALGKTDDLRRRYGNRYYIHLVHDAAPHTSDKDMERLKQWITSDFLGAEVEDKTYHGQLRFTVPIGNNGDIQEQDHDRIENSEANSAVSSARANTHIAKLFATLETAKIELGIKYYSVSRATLDQVFLNIVNGHNVAEEDVHRRTGGSRRQLFWQKNRL